MSCTAGFFSSAHCRTLWTARPAPIWYGFFISDSPFNAWKHCPEAIMPLGESRKSQRTTGQFPLASSGASSLMYSTYLGGIGEDSANGIAVDAAGNAYVAGTNYYADFPVTPGAFQTTVPNPNNCDSCAFVAKLNPAGSA